MRFPTLSGHRPLLLAAAAALGVAAMASALRLLPVVQPWPHQLDSLATRLLPRNLDAGVVVLFAPACLLMLALIYEVARRMTLEHLPQTAKPYARAIAHWQDETD